jgi:hypothetical protein
LQRLLINDPDHLGIRSHYRWFHAASRPTPSGQQSDGVSAIHRDSAKSWRCHRQEEKSGKTRQHLRRKRH